MKRIIKGQAPAFWTEYLKKHPRVPYRVVRDNGPDSGKSEVQKGIDSGLLRDIRSHMLAEQMYICPYCCRTIDEETSHNEHLKPQAKYENLSMDYQNLVACCRTENTCGFKKEDRYDERNFISPLEEDCEHKFWFLEEGSIGSDEPSGKYMIDLLNLNSVDLKWARRALFKTMGESAKICGKDYVKKYYIDPDESGRLPRFCDMASYFYQKGYFDDDTLAAMAR